MIKLSSKKVKLIDLSHMKIEMASKKSPKIMFTESYIFSEY